ncbi:MAG: Tim44/TimA family putative adaptor protein [Asticcacaulis sp.]
MPWELLILAMIAVVVLFQLYNVLGRRVGFKAEDKPQIPKTEDAEAIAGRNPSEVRLPERPRIPNLDALKARDAHFNEVNFAEKAREAYEQIVTAFNRGEIDGLKERLTETVFGVFARAIDARGENRSIRVSFVEPPKTDLDQIDLKEDKAWVRVRFLSELVYETGEGETDTKKTHGRTAEFWTFQKNLKSATNPWILSRVEAAKA